MAKTQQEKFADALAQRGWLPDKNTTKYQVFKTAETTNCPPVFRERNVRIYLGKKGSFRVGFKASENRPASPQTIVNLTGIAVGK